jgi:hypothetical protein
MDYKTMSDNLYKTYLQKNKAYGDSFSISLNAYGKIAALTRISDKFRRMENLILLNTNHEDESLQDTVEDMANYCIVFASWLDGQKK